ncbi:discoidin domain-containing protein [Streptomyces rapamycinicus]|uniref:F5/8 type C domain-containing protein n=2 Tax=Streptomyces rapamycinicus TaxID=1226757 RepID=A0A3L8R8G0_STRRN|nr:discoidin domain-containing protein [Streptomyces rapamycinicus]MBB4779272.1 hypothetical protein [Streptomyces rapamycinicus]RLV76065.1 hypothetical protein D3C57_142605 [Streptomyces rapamycinicus NRRL 5491]UTP28063.1 discoidin domain-containing protein [Streptomyces rapamycinicus NRRL 5491]
MFHTVASAAATSPLEVKSVTASADDGNVPANTLDNNLSTRWSSEGDGAWIRYDLGSAQTVGSVLVAWHQGDSRKNTFDVQLSADGSSWKTVLERKTSSGGTREQQKYDFADASARYLRIVGHGNTVSTGPASPRPTSTEPTAATTEVRTPSAPSGSRTRTS